MPGLPALREKMVALRREVRALRTALAGPRASLPLALRRRGILLGRADPTDGLLFPPRKVSRRMSAMYNSLESR